jgi:solute:Na+ symporter, SSS family
MCSRIRHPPSTKRSAKTPPFATERDHAAFATIIAGWTGLLLAGLAAAFVGTFAGTLNAARAYIINDLYLKYINPKASPQRTAGMNYVIGLAEVVVSITLGFFAKNVNNMLQWIVSGLYGSCVGANVLKWYWWRFNGYGYFWGMVAPLAKANYYQTIKHELVDIAF